MKPLPKISLGPHRERGRGTTGEGETLARIRGEEALVVGADDKRPARRKFFQEP